MAELRDRKVLLLTAVTEKVPNGKHLCPYSYAPLLHLGGVNKERRRDDRRISSRNVGHRNSLQVHPCRSQNSVPGLTLRLQLYCLADKLGSTLGVDTYNYFALIRENMLGGYEKLPAIPQLRRGRALFVYTRYESASQG